MPDEELEMAYFSYLANHSLIQRSRALIAAFITVGLLVGCATEREISPTISAPPRAGLTIKTPILGAVFDGRSSPDQKDVSSKLQADLRRIYSDSFEWGDYFRETPKGRVAVRIRIVKLGASFGSRLVSSIAFANAVSSAQVSATGVWGPIVGNVSSQQSVATSSFSGEGWWNGAAWIDLEVQDSRETEPISFTLPIVAEHRESNIWGYTSGDKAGRVAWDLVATQLVRALDSIVRTVRDQQ